VNSPFLFTARTKSAQHTSLNIIARQRLRASCGSVSSNYVTYDSFYLALGVSDSLVFRRETEMITLLN